MTPLHFLAITAASMVWVASKAAQQINVVRGYEKLVPFTTAAIAVCDVTIIGSVAQQAVTGSWLGLVLTCMAMTTGGSVGALGTMRLYRTHQ